MIRRMLAFTPRFMMVSLLVASGLGILSGSKVQAANANSNNGRCDVAIIIDTSGSVGNDIGQAMTPLKNGVKGLFGAFGTDGDEIWLAFWSFAGPSQGSQTIGGEPHKNGTYDDSVINPTSPINPYNSATYYQSSGAGAGFKNAINSMKSYGLTNYGWAFGFRNNDTRNPIVAGIADSADIIVFMTDGEPTAPYGGDDTDQADKNRGRQKAAYYQNNGIRVFGVPIAGTSATTSTINYVINGNQNNNTDVFTSSYANLPTNIKNNVGPACTPFIINYNLFPQITQVSEGQIVSPFGTIMPRAEADNTGPTNSKPTHWEMTRLVYAPGNNPTRTGGTSGPATVPCNFFSGAGRSSCSKITEGNNVVINASGGSKILGSANETLDYPLGTLVCYVASVKPYRHIGNDWRHSTMVCTKVAKKPHIHVQGGDLRVLGPIRTGTSSIGATTYGSWVEYGVFSVAQNNHIYSASTGSASDTLTFANTPTLGNFGALNSTNIESYFTGGNTDCSNIDITSAGRRDYRCDQDNMTLSETNLGGSVVIRNTKSGGIITIDNDIKRPDGASYTDAKSIPQLVLIANKILIKGAVRQIDAWLLATGPNGTIDTCYDRPEDDRVNAKECDQALIINGPVRTDILRLFRTFGADANNREAAAETFNLRPDAYLWLYARNDRIKIRTNAIHELPPRY